MGTASSSSSEGLIPARSAATSSAFAICLDTLRLPIVAFIRPSAPIASDPARDPSAAAALFASRSSRTSLLEVPEVPKWRPMSSRIASTHGSSTAAAAHIAPRTSATLASTIAGFQTT